MIYDIGSDTQSSGKFASQVSISEDKVARHYKPIFYGVEQDEKLKFDIVFGVNDARLTAGEYLDRHELEAIGSWLTGLDGYRWLEICQDDMLGARYRCIVTSLEIIEHGLIPWALSMTVECDGVYAYGYEKVFEYEVDGSRDVLLYNESSYNGYYYPRVSISLSSGDSFKIANKDDGGREFSFSSLPTSIRKLEVDNERGIITSGNSGLNPYPYFNYKFFRLKRGDNHLSITGHGIVKFICEFPMNMGG